MIFDVDNINDKKASKYILAMHSSTDTFGLSVLEITNSFKSKKSKTFEARRNLSNNLFQYVESVLPFSSWKNLIRIAVATGPGGFTSTRISVAMARTIAQQIGCPLDGIGSFYLMAPRLLIENKLANLANPFWIVQPLKRRGKVAGCYKLNRPNDSKLFTNIFELNAPKLYANDVKLDTSFLVREDVIQDVNTLVDISFHAYLQGDQNSWQNVNPIYPTSPVGEDI